MSTNGKRFEKILRRVGISKDTFYRGAVTAVGLLFTMLCSGTPMGWIMLAGTAYGAYNTYNSHQVRGIGNFQGVDVEPDSRAPAYSRGPGADLSGFAARNVNQGRVPSGPGRDE